MSDFRELCGAVVKTFLCWEDDFQQFTASFKMHRSAKYDPRLGADWTSFFCCENLSCLCPVVADNQGGLFSGRPVGDQWRRCIKPRVLICIITRGRHTPFWCTAPVYNAGNKSLDYHTEADRGGFWRRGFNRRLPAGVTMENGACDIILTFVTLLSLHDMADVTSSWAI